MKLSTLWPAIEETAHAAGATHVGASDLDDEHADLFEGWLGSGHHASMRWLERNAAVRLHPRERFPWARSAVVILVPYPAERPPAASGAISHHIARYALGDDYHDVLEAMLREIETVICTHAPGTTTWRYVDTGPLSDRALAANAGLGWIGRNGMLIHEHDGSFFFIGTLLTALDNDIRASEVGDRCGSCTRCVEACPTDAILPSRLIASERCISYATIEHRGPLEPELGTHLAGNAFGCDICQEVCPWNEQAPDPHPAFAPREAYRSTPITDLLRFTQADFSALFRRSAVKRARFAGMQRNVELLTNNR